MDENTAKLEQRIKELETRIEKLEGTEKVVSAFNKSVGSEGAKAKPEGESKGRFSAFKIVLLIAGALILYAILSSFFYGLGSSPIILIVLLGAGWFVYKALAGGQRSRAPAPTFSEQASKSTTPENNQNAPQIKKEGQSLEFMVASHWFSIVGIIAIVLGVVFFLKFAFDNGLIGPVGQVSIGIFFGLALLAAGEYFRKKYQDYSQIITGGGILVLYLSLWASFALFHLLSAEIVLFSMSFVTLTAALLSIRYDAIAVAILGIVGGFTAPILLSKGFDSQILLMSYIIILDLGVLLIAVFKNWLRLKLLSFAGTFIVFLTWYSTYYTDDKLLITQIFLTILFLIFGFVYFIYNVTNKKITQETDIILMLANAVIYFGFSYLILSESYRDFLGFFAFTLAAFYFVLGYFSYSKFKEDSPLTLGFLGISIFFLTIAVPLQVKKHLITIVWALEGLILSWAGFWLSSYRLRVAALAVYILVGIRLFAFDTRIDVSEFALLINNRFITFCAAIISALIAGWLYNFYKVKVQEDERPVLPALLIIANIAFIWAISWESISYFGSKIQQDRQGTPSSLNSTPDYNRYNESPRSISIEQRSKISSLESRRDISLSIIWLFYSICLTIVGIIKKYQPIRLFAIAFFSLTILKVFLFDSRNLEQGYRIIAFIVLGVILLSVSLIYQKYKDKIEALLLK